MQPRYHHLADNFVYLVRNTLNDCEGRSQAHAALAYVYMQEVTAKLQAIYRLSKDEAAAQAQELSGNQGSSAL